MQPQVGVAITAHTLTDPDGNASNVRNNSNIEESEATWQWYRSSSKAATGTAISTTTVGSTGTGAAYTPVAADVGHHLRVKATYDDGRGDGKIATAVSEYMTIARITSNTAPKFSAERTTRAVLEEADAGTNIGSPVAATDADSGEVLTYWLSTGTDNDKFDIDAKTGQLKVKNVLDYEGPAVDNCEGNDNVCEVTVNVADSSNSNTVTIIVTINVIGVDEKPIFSVGPTTIVHEEGETELDVDPAMENVAAAEYMVMDPEQGIVTLSLSGVDASKFKLNELATAVTPPNYSKVLAFKDKPDFEMPGDSNRDNVYQVTVVASDGVNSAMRDVTVKVTDMPEDGVIEVAPSQPRVGTALTATLTDSDGVISSTTWKWRKEMTDTPTQACFTITDDEWTPVPDPDTTLIKDAESATYTPVSDDDGYCLRVEVSYLDMSYVGMP